MKKENDKKWSKLKDKDKLEKISLRKDLPLST